VAAAAVLEPGRAHLYREGDTSFERWVLSKDCARHVQRYRRMRLYSPFADDCVRGGYRGALNYHNAQAIYPVDVRRQKGDSRVKRRNRRRLASWILRDRRGRPLYIPFACARGRCPQFAGDIGNRRYRARIVRQIKEVMGRGYAGVFFDDVNWNLNVSDGRGRPVAPIDPRTGVRMTPADWRRYLADFVQQVDAAVPGKELVINSVWWKPESTLDDPDVLRGVQAADVYELERGLEDVFRGQSFDGLLATIDRLHGLGLGVNLDGYLSTTRARAELEMAVYFLISTGRDSFGAEYGSCPDNRGGSPCEEPFWKGYETNLGDPLADREVRPDLMLQRRFQRGMVLVNPPGAPPREAELDGLYEDLNGQLRLRVTLDGGEGAVLRRFAAFG
jgi:hypothetical protein